MKIWEITRSNKNKPEYNMGYCNIDDKGRGAFDRALIIEDDDGNKITLKNKQIGELYHRIKPSLAG